MSVKPQYAELLLSGVRTFELRRVRPKIAAGGLVLIYASSPATQMVGTGTVAEVAVAITLEDVRPLRHGIPLAERRRRVNGFRPPQSFRHMPQSHVLAVI